MAVKSGLYNLKIDMLDLFQGKTVQNFVIEVSVKPWDPYDQRNPTVGGSDVLKIQPYYEDEEGKVYFRQQASCVQVHIIFFFNF
jgi:hypothetical protein